MTKQEQKPGPETFLVRVTHCENGTWQGTVQWAENGRTMNFRSMLELIRLMDDALLTVNAKERTTWY